MARFALEGVPRNVKTPAAVVVVLGATPAPPPITKALAVSAADDANVPAAVKAKTPPEVPVVKPVPPRATGKDVVKPVKSTSQEAAVVPVIKIQVNNHVVFGVTVATKLLPDELTVRSPVELL